MSQAATGGASQLQVDDERHLVARALGGDDMALKALIAMLTPVVQCRVAAVLLRMRSGRVDRRQEAQDLTQEVFLRLFQDGARILKSWDPERGAGLAGFVGLVAQRQAISALRGKHETPLSDDLHEVEYQLPATAAGQERQATTRQQLVRLLDLLRARLSPLGLELFYRLFVDAQDVSEICAATDLTSNAVYIWRNRLLKLVTSLQSELGITPAPVAAERSRPPSREQPTSDGDGP